MTIEKMLLGTNSGGPTISASSQSVFESASSDQISIALGNGKMVVVYRDAGNSSYPTLVVGEVVSGVASFGTPLQLNNVSGIPTVCHDASLDKFVITYQHGTTQHTHVGTVTGLTMSLGTVSNIATTSNYSHITAYGGKAYFVGSSGSSKCFLYVGTISGTDITWGPSNTIQGGTCVYIGVAYDVAQDKVVVSYDYNQIKYMKVGTITGTSVSFGAAYTFHSGLRTFDASLIYDPNNNNIIASYRDYAGWTTGYVKICTISGTTVTCGATNQIYSGFVGSINSTLDADGNLVTVYSKSDTSYHGEAVVSVIDGTSLDVGASVVYNSNGRTDYSWVDYDSNGNSVVAYQDDGNSSYGTSSVLTTA